MPPLCKHSQDSISSPLDYNLAHTLLEIELGGNIAVCFFAQDVAFFFIAPANACFEQYHIQVFRKG